MRLAARYLVLRRCQPGRRYQDPLWPQIRSQSRWITGACMTSFLTAYQLSQQHHHRQVEPGQRHRRAAVHGYRALPFARPRGLDLTFAPPHKEGGPADSAKCRRNMFLLVPRWEHRKVSVLAYERCPPASAAGGPREPVGYLHGRGTERSPGGRSCYHARQYGLAHTPATPTHSLERGFYFVSITYTPSQSAPGGFSFISSQRSK